MQCPKGYFFVDNIKELRLLFSKLFTRLSIWASESSLRSALVLLFLFIFVWPFLFFLQKEAEKFPYILMLKTIFKALFIISTRDFIISLLFIIYFLLIYELYTKYKESRVVEDSFKNGLSKWAVPQGAGWTVQYSIIYQKLGKMLAVTNSFYPGLLKEAYTWYDYELQFKALIPSNEHESKENLTFFVRAEDNYNGVMFQVTKTHIKPHLLYDSTYIRDTENDISLPTILDTNVWNKIKVRVIGDEVTITINDFKLMYKIHSHIFNFVRKDLLQQTVLLSDLKRGNEEMKSALEDLIRARQAPNDSRREFEIAKAQEKFDRYVDAAGAAGFTKVILEYQKGSVGFRESDFEKAYFKDFKLKKI